MVNGEIFNIFWGKNGVTSRENKRTVAFFFEERASQKRALGPVSTV